MWRYYLLFCVYYVNVMLFWVFCQLLSVNSHFFDLTDSVIPDENQIAYSYLFGGILT